MRTFKLIILLMILTIGLNFSLSAQQDKEGSSDPAIFPSRIPGFYIDNYETNDFSVYTFAKTNGQEIEVQGKKTIITYRRKEGAKTFSSAYITLNYQTAAKKLLPANDFVGEMKLVYCTEIKNSTSDTWIRLASYVGDGTAEATDTYVLTIIERSLMEQVIVANEIQSNLKSTGHIALYIQFDTGLSTIKPESKKAVDEIASFLEKNASTKVFIVGHTDNQGNFEANLKLSLDRANAVVTELTTKYAIPATQVTAKGAGSICPLSSNDTEQGKKENRRVELVKQ